MSNEIQRFDFKGASLPGDGQGTEDNIILETQHGNPTSTLPADTIGHTTLATLKPSQAALDAAELRR